MCLLACQHLGSLCNADLHRRPSFHFLCTRAASSAPGACLAFPSFPLLPKPAFHSVCQFTVILNSAQCTVRPAQRTVAALGLSPGRRPLRQRQRAAAQEQVARCEAQPKHWRHFSSPGGEQRVGLAAAPSCRCPLLLLLLLLGCRCAACCRPLGVPQAHAVVCPSRGQQGALPLAVGQAPDPG